MTDHEMRIERAENGLKILEDLARKAEEWHNARMAVSSLSIKDPQCMKLLNRLSEAEDALSRIFTAP